MELAESGMKMAKCVNISIIDGNISNLLGICFHFQVLNCCIFYLGPTAFLIGFNRQ